MCDMEMKALKLTSAYLEIHVVGVDFRNGFAGGEDVPGGEKFDGILSSIPFSFSGDAFPLEAEKTPKHERI